MYPGFESKVWSGIQKSIGDGYYFGITKGPYTTKFPPTTINAVNGQIQALSSSDYEVDLRNLAERATQKASANPDPELFREKIIEALRILLSRKTVAPFLVQATPSPRDSDDVQYWSHIF